MAPEQQKTRIPNRRKAYLADAWYPGHKAGILEFMGKALETEKTGPRPGKPGQGGLAAALVPHAGWVFSGALAARTIARAVSALGQGGPELVAVLGGHLGPGSPVVAFREECWESPLGDVELCPDLNPALEKIVPIKTWLGPTADNTIEVVMPMLAHLAPRARAIAIRVPPDRKSIDLSAFFRDLASQRRLLVIASSDLTHYGPSYGFFPAGPGAAGREYARRNDRAFVEAALSGEAEKLLELGNRSKAACSAGGVALSAALAQAGQAASHLVGLSSSLDIRPNGEDHVGYAGIVWDFA
jgi:AmmeMemoRadiSam system protein B